VRIEDVEMSLQKMVDERRESQEAVEAIENTLAEIGDLFESNPVVLRAFVDATTETVCGYRRRILSGFLPTSPTSTLRLMREAIGEQVLNWMPKFNVENLTAYSVAATPEDIFEMFFFASHLHTHDRLEYIPDILQNSWRQQRGRGSAPPPPSNRNHYSPFPGGSM
jgi:hypothetical protein